jgi:hypothetical protein
MKFPIPTRISTAICAFFLSLTLSQGQKVLDENFESHDPGTPAEGLHSSDASPAQWNTIGFDSAGAPAVVVEGASTSGSGNNQRLLHAQRAEAPGMNLGIFFDEITADSAPNGISAGMKFKVEEMDGQSDVVFAFLEKSTPSFRTTTMAGIFRIRFQEPNHSQFAYHAGRGDSDDNTYIRIQDVPFHAGQWYELKITLNLAAQTWGFLLTNLDTGEFATVEEIPLERDVYSVTGIGFSNRTPPAAMNHFFDDFTVEILE